MSIHMGETMFPPRAPIFLLVHRSELIAALAGQSPAPPATALCIGELPTRERSTS
jgi:hypothetical protein